MIRYHHGYWGIRFLFQVKGSVFPKAAIWAIPSSFLALIFSVMKETSGYMQDNSAGTALAGVASFVSILGFMVVFRSNQAWNRYWEGADLVSSARGEWVSATSSLFAFCSRDPARAAEVSAFRGKMARFVSLMYGYSLSALAGGESFDTFDMSDFDQVALGALEGETGHEVKLEMVMQWIQVSIMDAIDAKIVTAAPPIVSRVFNELSGGVVKISSARKINDLPFPFHYGQMLGVMLIIFTFGVPAFSAYLMETWWGSMATTFVNVFVLWCVNYLASEIEEPFGKDANDLPLEEEMQMMNDTLEMLLKSSSMSPPAFECVPDIPKPPELRSLSKQLQRASVVRAESFNRGISLVDIATQGTSPRRNDAIVLESKAQVEAAALAVPASSTPQATSATLLHEHESRSLSTFPDGVAEGIVPSPSSVDTSSTQEASATKCQQPHQANRGGAGTRGNGEDGLGGAHVAVDSEESLIGAAEALLQDSSSPGSPASHGVPAQNDSHNSGMDERSRSDALPNTIAE